MRQTGTPGGNYSRVIEIPCPNSNLFAHVVFLSDNFQIFLFDRIEIALLCCFLRGEGWNHLDTTVTVRIFVHVHDLRGEIYIKNVHVHRTVHRTVHLVEITRI